jgi:hypothetical protein
MSELEIKVTRHTGFTNNYHPLPKGKEWMYFLIQTDSTMIPGCIGIDNNQIGHMWAAVYDPNQQPVNVAVRTTDIEALEDRCLYRVGNNKFFEEHGTYSIEIQTPELTLHAQGTATINTPDNTLKARYGPVEVDWIFPVIRGTCSGTYKSNKIKQEFTGRFFHDHNKVTVHKLNLRRKIQLLTDVCRYRGWAWGIYMDKTETKVYAHVSMGKRSFNLFVHEKDGKIKYSHPNVAVQDTSVNIKTPGTGIRINYDTVHTVPMKGWGKIRKITAPLVVSKHAYREDGTAYMERRKVWWVR